MLEELARTGNVAAACLAARIGRSTYYRWLDEPKFAESAQRAEDAYIDSLELEADRRAVQGVEKPAGWYKGVAGGTVTEYSDSLLMFRLKSLRPEKYRERVELKGSLANLDLTQLSDDQLSRILRGENPLTVLGGAIEPPHQLPQFAGRAAVRSG